MVDRRPTVHHDDEGAFTTEEVDKELEEGVDGKRLQTAVSGDLSYLYAVATIEGAHLVYVS